MITAPATQQATESETVSDVGKKSRRRQTAHLKIVPETKEIREGLRRRCAEVVSKLDKSHTLTKDEMEVVARRILADEQKPEGYLGWMMVVLASEFWRDQVAATDPSRRLFLLPHCLKHAEGCPADYDDFGLDCKKCGACSIADFRSVAEEMGYKVLVAEGSPIVLKIIVSGYVDAIVGVACLNVLEKAIDKILLAGIPCMAIPLLSSDCRNTSVDEDWVNEMICISRGRSVPATRSYVHLMRAANDLFKPEKLESIAPRVRSTLPISTLVRQERGKIDPLAGTEAIAYDFLSRGGKYARPFITLAAYDALTGSHGTTAQGAEHVASYSDAILRTAMSIESFHKASLVHDDIEDDDGYRYGEETLHRKHGLSTAINVGDYLIGMGYRLVSRDIKSLSAETVAEILDGLAEAHLRLSEGQGAELLWRDSSNKQLTPLDALKIYALKTAPAFEAALFSGLRLAGPVAAYRDPVRQFARNLGVAFQILNDLKDWNDDDNNKLGMGGDILGGRPTILWAMALESLGSTKQSELISLVTQNLLPASERVVRVRALYEEAGVFDKALRLIDKHQERATAIAEQIQPESLQRLLYYLIDTVLERPVMPDKVQPKLVELGSSPAAP